MNISFLRLALAALLVYLFRPFLLALLPIPTEDMVSGFLNTSTEEGQSTLGVLRFTVWTLLFYALLSSGGLLGRLGRKVTAGAESKPIRRVKGVLAEIFMFLAIFLLLFLPILSYRLYDLRIYMRGTSVLYSENLKNNFGFIEAGRKALLKLHEPTRLGMSDAEIQQKYDEKKIKEPLWNRQIDQADSVLELLGKETLPPEPEFLGRETIDSDMPYELKQAFENANLDDYNDPQNLKSLEVIESYLSPNIQKSVGSMTASTYWEEMPEQISKAFKASAIFVIPLTILLFYLGRFQFRSVVSSRLSQFFMLFEPFSYGLGGRGRFAGLLSEWGAQHDLKKNPLYMGRSLYHPKLKIGLDGEQHMLTVAPSRTGKGSSVIIPNLLLWEQSVILIDPKGTAAAVTSRRRKEMGQNVYILDPFKRLESQGVDFKTTGFNPLNHLDPESYTFDNDVKAIADALVIRTGQEKEPYFNNMAQLMIEGAVAHMVTTPEDYPEPSLSLLPTFYPEFDPSNPERVLTLLRKMMTNKKAGNIPLNAANAYMKGTRRDSFTNVELTYIMFTNWLNLPNIEPFLSTQYGVPLDELKQKPTTVFLVVDEIALNIGLIRLFLNQCRRTLTKAPYAKQPVLMIIDEFLSLGRMPQIETAFSELAGFNLTIWPFVQSLGTLEQIYGANWDTFTSNSRAVQAFAVSDRLAKEMISEELGERDVRQITSKVNNDSIAMRKVRTTSEVKKDTRRVTARQYVMTKNTPFVLERLNYWDDPALKGMWDEDPQYKKA